MDFTKFKNIVTDLYQRQAAPIPNFSTMKHSFDFVDIRRDGNIDLNEWLRTFSKVEVSLYNISLIWILRM